MTATPLTTSEVESALARLDGRVRRTPVLTLAPGDLGPEVLFPLTLKLELLQHAGSFKPRGAFNRVLAEPVRPATLVAASGGNHGAAVAFVGRQLGVPARIFVPSVTSAMKQERITGFGAELVLAGAIYDDAQEAADEFARDSGGLLVHPYDHRLVVAGQATVGFELDEQAPQLDTVLVAVGGGGLLAGVASWYRDRAKVVSVEPATIPAMHSAIAAGSPVEVEVSGLAADSLGARRIGDVPWACASPYVRDAVLVSDDAIREAQRRLWSAVRLVAEPGGAAALAAVLSGAYVPADGERVGVIVCGSNTDPATVVQAIE